MSKLKHNNPPEWVIRLAAKHGIDVDTVISFYNSITAEHNRPTKAKRTIDFFDMYFEGRNYDKV